MGVRLATLAILFGACGTDDDRPFVYMDFTRADGLFAAPFPADDLLVDGRPDVSAFPNPSAVSTIDAAPASSATDASQATACPPAASISRTT